MKVLWFCNTPALGEEYLKSRGIGGGWMKALINNRQKCAELTRNAYYTMLNIWSPANVADNLIKLFDSLYNDTVLEIREDSPCSKTKFCNSKKILR